MPPILRDVDELKAPITEAVATIDNAMMVGVCQEFDYWLDVCRVTNMVLTRNIFEHSM